MACKEKPHDIAVRPKSLRYKYVAFNQQHKIIAAGRTVLAAVRRAKATGQKFCMMFIPPGNLYSTQLHMLDRPGPMSRRANNVR